MKNEKLSSLIGTTFDTELEDSSNSILQVLTQLLYTFFSIDTYFNYQKGLQLFILVVNAVMVGFQVITIFIKIVTRNDLKEGRLSFWFTKLEVYFTFILDVACAVIGAIAYVKIRHVLKLVKEMQSYSCSDDYSNSKYSAYTNALDGTGDLNLGILIVICFKLALALFTIIYYLIGLGCRINCRLLRKTFFESISGGEEYSDDYEKQVEKMEAEKEKIQNQNEFEMKQVGNSMIKDRKLSGNYDEIESESKENKTIKINNYVV